jgi:hypothetical protein
VVNNTHIDKFSMDHPIVTMSRYLAITFPCSFFAGFFQRRPVLSEMTRKNDFLKISAFLTVKLGCSRKIKKTFSFRDQSIFFAFSENSKAIHSVNL